MEKVRFPGSRPEQYPYGSSLVVLNDTGTVVRDMGPDRDRIFVDRGWSSVSSLSWVGKFVTHRTQQGQICLGVDGCGNALLELYACLNLPFAKPYLRDGSCVVKGGSAIEFTCGEAAVDAITEGSQTGAQACCGDGEANG